ncbi:isopenicillin N synthase family dioxygenase [Nocardioides sp. CPCC 205120]|uniref:isopenicillin N synthase family dioxygenase n=1 Tax=Nocardioides sp. CPCC 205120 TaxID=3406462 RepID=UPI003B503905
MTSETTTEAVRGGARVGPDGFHVPTVDISAYVGEGDAAARAAAAAAFDEAARTVGFVQVVGHGVPDDVLRGFADALDGFFGLPLEAKKAYRTPPEVNRGYSPPKTESLSLSLGVAPSNRMHDFFEAFNVGLAVSDFPGLDLPLADYPENVWPDEDLGAAGFRAAVSAYFDEAGRVARTLTTLFADALGLEPGYFDAFTGHSVDVLRMNNYALEPGAVELDGDLTGMGAHTDYGIVTVLWADQVAGLQVLGADGSWNDVMPADGALLINLGDLMARWTNDHWMSTVHRVKPPIVDGTIRRRRSAAYFHDGDIDAVVATLPTCRDADGTSAYPPVTVAEHLRAKLAGSRAGVANAAAAREAARVLAAGEA